MIQKNLDKMLIKKWNGAKRKPEEMVYHDGVLILMVL